MKKTEELIIMVISETTIKLVTITYALFALSGAFIVTYTAFTVRKRVDNTLLRARAFINESFLRDTGALLFLAFVFFFIHTILELNTTLGFFIEESVSEFMIELTELGIALCIVILAYKWFKLINPEERF